jgi:hypothetical protein
MTADPGYAFSLIFLFHRALAFEQLNRLLEALEQQYALLCGDEGAAESGAGAIPERHAQSN